MKKLVIMFFTAAFSAVAISAGVLPPPQRSALEAINMPDAMPDYFPVETGMGKKVSPVLINLIISKNVKNPQILNYLKKEFMQDITRADTIAEQILGKTHPLKPKELSIVYMPGLGKIAGTNSYPGNKMTCLVDAAKDAVWVQNVSFHEIGHAVFFDYQIMFSPAGLERYQTHYAAATGIARARELAKQTANPRWQELLTAEELAALRMSQIYKTVALRYDELMADAFAVVTLKRPKLAFRDFSTFSPNIEGYVSAKQRYDLHPVRGYLWQYCLKDRIEDTQYTTNVLRRLMRVCVEEIEDIYQASKQKYFLSGNLRKLPDEDVLAIPSVEELNRRLIKRFEAAKP